MSQEVDGLGYEPLRHALILKHQCAEEHACRDIVEVPDPALSQVLADEKHSWRYHRMRKVARRPDHANDSQ